MSDRLTSALEAFVRSVFGQRLDYLASYWARVISQNADGTLELVPDDSRLPTYSKVPIRHGVPGVTATVAPGARVLLEFAAADPQKRFVTHWESASVTLLQLAGTTGMQGAGLGANLRTELDALWTAITAHVHPETGTTTGTATYASSKQTVESSIVKVKP